MTTSGPQDRPLLLPAQPGDDDGPHFVEPWQAEAFALTHVLADAGLFTWSEWTAALAAAIAAAQRHGDPDLGDTYYDHWLVALEGLCAEKRVVNRVAVDERQEAWRHAYRHTEHGKAVELAV